MVFTGSLQRTEYANNFGRNDAKSSRLYLRPDQISLKISTSEFRAKFWEENLPTVHHYLNEALGIAASRAKPSRKYHGRCWSSHYWLKTCSCWASGRALAQRCNSASEKKYREGVERDARCCSLQKRATRFRRGHSKCSRVVDNRRPHVTRHSAEKELRDSPNHESIEFKTRLRCQKAHEELFLQAWLC